MEEKRPWQERVEQYILSHSEGIDIESLMEVAGSSVTRRSLSSYIEEAGLTLTEDGDQLVPAWAVFRDARVLIAPQRWEIEAGILVPGHRLLPLYDARLSPADLEFRQERRSELSDSSGASGFRRRTTMAPLSKALAYFSLFGFEMLGLLLASEDEANSRVDLTDFENAVVRLSALDMGEFFNHYGFREGDYVEAHLESWRDGRFAVSYRSRDEVSANRRSEWIEALEEAMWAVLEHTGEPKDIPKQLRYAYYFAATRRGRKFLTEPGATVGEFLAADNPFSIRPVETEGNRSMQATTIWDDSKMSFRPLFSEAATAEAAGVTGDLEEILNDIGSALSIGEVEAYMRDALHDGKDIHSVLRRVFSGSHLPFAGAAQAESFYDELERLWKRLAGSYDAETDIAAPVRARLLALYDKYLRWIRSLDAREMNPSELPEDAMRTVGEFFSMITGAVELLNRDLTGQEDDLDMLREQLDTLEPTAEQVLNDAEEQVTASVGQLPIYELKVSIRGIRPQIWRRIRVPGWFSLAQLHRIIQEAMEWSGGHLHAFYIHGSVFMPQEAGDFDEYVEEDYRLADLGLAQKARFRYVYDFGDNWEHEILVSKVLDPTGLSEPERTTPRVLSGKRASPPEDCGGVGGYYELWSETIPSGREPEPVNIEEINARLAGM